ncbi:MAG: hypothetical protein IT379_28820 [Deltaproteobacteria bacterium]|nr:hypothetical protein [Deltaproteobacteria bacterium]
MIRERIAGARSVAWIGVAGVLWAACSREGLDVPDGSRSAVVAPPDAGRDAGRDARVQDARDGDGCVAQLEVCNGRDDDCDGSTDEGVEVLPCPNGGESICIAGSYSACPRRCEVCVPASERICFISFCKIWGRQVCQADGFGWGGCSEEDPPSVCAGDGPFGAAPDGQVTHDCCVSLGLCCVDRWDGDRDGDTDEAFGACEATFCE